MPFIRTTILISYKELYVGGPLSAAVKLLWLLLLHWAE